MASHHYMSSHYQWYCLWHGSRCCQPQSAGGGAPPCLHCRNAKARVCVHVPRACFLANEQMYKHVHTYSIHGFKQICHWFLNALFCFILSNRFFAVRSVIPCKNCSNGLKVCTLKQLVDFKWLQQREAESRSILAAVCFEASPLCKKWRTSGSSVRIDHENMCLIRSNSTGGLTALVDHLVSLDWKASLNTYLQSWWRFASQRGLLTRPLVLHVLMGNMVSLNTVCVRHLKIWCMASHVHRWYYGW